MTPAPGTVPGLVGAPVGPGALIDALVGAAPGSAWRIAPDGAAVDLRSPARAVRPDIDGVSGDRAGKGPTANPAKLLLARWPEVPPRILVLEEPTRGVDIGTKRAVDALIREMAESGTVVVWWSTQVPEPIEICDRVVAFDLCGEVSGTIAGAQVDEVALPRATGMAAQMCSPGE